jgi:hypothetical protein
MDTQKLVAAIETEIEKEGRLPEEKIFLRLLKEVWQVDWTVAPYDVWTNILQWNIPYFLRFMGGDQGDEERENQLIQDWISLRTELQNSDSGGKQRVITLINDVNHLRMAVTQDV